MRMLRLVLTAVVLAPAVGCNWMKQHWGDTGPRPGPRPTEKLPDVAPDRLVGYLNDRAGQFHSVSYDDVRLQVSRVMTWPALEGNLTCAQPRNFRMKVAKAGFGADVDLGSNPNEFWMYLRVPAESPVYVYASHNDFAEGKARLPDNVPFEPDWVMQALGMKTFTLAEPGRPSPYRVTINERERTYTLWWETATPSGAQIIKEIVFDGDSAAAPRPQVKRHVVKDAKSKKVICSADIKTVQSMPVGTDPSTGYPMNLQYPTRIVLRWEEQRFEMDLHLNKPQVNQPIPDEQARHLFSRPVIQNANPIDLAARYEYR